MTYLLKAIGTDTEVFLRDKEGKPVSVCGRLGGTKKDPRPVPALGKGFAVQEDNVMAEFNLPPVNRGDAGKWQSNCTKMRNYLQFYFEGQGLTLAHEGAMHFDPEQLNSEQAQTFGCDPDYSVWLQQANFIDTGSPELRSLRTAGGHVHVSFVTNENNDLPGVADVTRLVKVLDVFLGVPSSLYDPDTLRRQFYGKAGAFRPKPYGVEYRVLSGFWFANSDLCDWVYSAVHDAFRFFRHTRMERVDEMLDKYANLIQEAINAGNKEAANKVIECFGVRMIGAKPAPEINLEGLIPRLREAAGQQRVMGGNGGPFEWQAVDPGAQEAGQPLEQNQR